MTSRYQGALDVALRAAREAGALLREEFYRPGGPRGNTDKAPSDREAEALIRNHLFAHSEEYGFRGEEDPTFNRLPKDPERHFWLVDPNDGTAAFYQGYRGAAVSIALIRKDTPVLGVIYAYAEPDDEGDLFFWAEGMESLVRNGVAVARPSWPDALSSSHTVLVSHKADTRPMANAQGVFPSRFLAVPSLAYRLALCAAGEGVAAVGLSSPRDLDYAAGHALLRSAGAILLDEEGRPVTYDEREMRQVQYCFGGAPGIAPVLAGRSWGAALKGPTRKALRWDLVQPVRGALFREAGPRSRAQGCLLGQLAGDSLGSLVEFQSEEQIQKVYPKGPDRLLDGGTFHTLAGQPTDDSELALLLARSLVNEGRFDEEDVAQAYVFWYESDPFDIGGTTQRALSAGLFAKREQSGSVAKAARRAANLASQANGALMRVSPLGIFGHAHSAEEVAAWARKDASLTHPNPVCQDASAVFVVAIARAISLGETPRALYEFTVRWAEEQGIHPDVQETLRAAASKPPADFLHQMGWVRIALQNAFYQLLFAPSLEEGVRDTVRRGGDTDTNAAICGALLGAVYGRSAIPAQWCDRVLTARPLSGLEGVAQPRPSSFWPTDALILAERLLLAGAKARG